ncbi:glycosyltransferase family 32 protein [Vibrio mangrovi]|uniref:Glycosyltransferase n=1 Tax=Vibrio mangrovi TaxID=474394 RepID=A0A1Y6IZU5_9VIBR|nr:glycosyltransferase [Vibrio mangrovi]MDW6002208.1 glycosyltransferase [Vibrio mangrovi]SMS01553.1 Glycosyltransferase sugar-binding region containing DXD motif protein [Vibrio mangrovi]
MNIAIFITNRCIRLIGNLFKMLSYPFHLLFPRTRFTIPVYSKAKVGWSNTGKIPRTIWQTNYSNRCTLPVYLNYLFNRLMSLDYDYRYVSTEDREIFMRDHAPEHVYRAYQQLTDGAAQADLWRLTVLHQQGGIYMDIDATLVWPLRKLLKNEQEALYIKFKKGNTDYTNFFLATVPNNPHYKLIMDTIVHNIENYDVKKGVYGTTGPEALNSVLQGKKVHALGRNYVCIQGTFTNEHFQYLDKPQGKWTHQDPKNLIKK